VNGGAAISCEKPCCANKASNNVKNVLRISVLLGGD
jgi:hypothetical protein